MYTLKQIVTKIKAFATAHKQINSFHYGYLDDVLKEKDPLFPCLVVTLKPKTVGQEDNFNFEILVADVVRPTMVGETGLGNELEVQSDTDLICKDVLKYFEHAFSDLKISDSVTLEDFSVNKSSKEIAGFFFPISLIQYNDHDFCAIPAEDIDIPADLNYVTIVDQDGNTVATLRPGETYTVTVVSAIDGGNATTIFTNTVIGE